MFCELITKVVPSGDGATIWTRNVEYTTKLTNLEVDKVYLLTTDGYEIIDAKEQPFEIIEGRASMVKVYGDTCSFYVGDRHFIAHGHLINGNEYKLWVVGKTVYKFQKVTI